MHLILLRRCLTKGTTVVWYPTYPVLLQWYHCRVLTYLELLLRITSSPQVQGKASGVLWDPDTFEPMVSQSSMLRK